MSYAIAGGLALVSFLGLFITLVGLPGTWLIVFSASLVKLIWPASMDWWALIVLLLLAVLAEVAEFLSSAAGAAKRGGSRAGLIGSVVGGLAGAIMGTVLILIPIVGTIVGGIIGAAAGAFIAERGVSQRTWREAGSIAQGAAVGRALATIIKSGFALIMGAVAVTAALVA